jgi:hypothetical protein
MCIRSEANNGPRRVMLTVRDGDAHDVEIVDYDQESIHGDDRISCDSPLHSFGDGDDSAFNLI